MTSTQHEREPAVVPDTQGPGLSARRLLLAEDDAAMRALLAQILERAGYEVLVAEDGLHLITLLDWSTSGALPPPFDAIISDVRMPGADGMRILRWLRAHGSQIPVVLITAFGTPELHAEAERLGATLIDKPFDVEQLSTALQSNLQPPTSRAMAMQQQTKATPPPANPPPSTQRGAPSPSSSKPDTERPGQAPNQKRTRFAVERGEDVGAAACAAPTRILNKGA